MERNLKWTGLVLLAAGVGLALAFAFNASIQAQSPGTFVQRDFAQATPYFSEYRNPSNSQYDYRRWGMGRGMMSRGYHTDIWDYSSDNTPLTLDKAIEAAHQYLAAYGNPDLALTEMMEFTDNFYAEVGEKGTNVHAFELLIDCYSGAVYPEPGPNMMWNTKYGHLGRMWGGLDNRQAEPMSVTPKQALEIAQGWLDQYQSGTSVDVKTDAFYGYYTIHTLKDGQVVGMLSVNGYTGEVWYHTWHGNFVDMRELED